MTYPQIIQGGMGVAVSSWSLARTVSMRGQLGVVSGTALDLVIARRLQLGDIGGHIEEALAHFPVPEIAERVWNRYFIKGGKDPHAPFKSKPMPTLHNNRAFLDLSVVGNFVEVWLAKKGHNNPVGINFLTKIQINTLPSLFGAVLAGVDFVIMGAGIPRTIPRVLDLYAAGQVAALELEVAGLKEGQTVTMEFDPTDYLPEGGTVGRPQFLAIVSTALLAQVLAKKGCPPPDGFVIEGPTAGGHNAPPRGPLNLNENGEPIYGEKDIADLAKIAELGLPFWLAGSYGREGKLVEALEAGAQGIQVGTAFAFCEDSGMDPELRRRIVAQSAAGHLKIKTDALASPTGFPFKVVGVDQTLAEQPIYEARNRICDLGYLREPFMQADGRLGYRCASEPIEDFVEKGGEVEETVGRKCICNGLMSTIGLGQIRKDGYAEPPIVTAGDDVTNLARYLKPGATSYSANDVIDYLLGKVEAKAV